MKTKRRKGAIRRAGREAATVALSVLAAAGPAADAQAQVVNCFQSLIYGSIAPCTVAGTETVEPDGSVSKSCVNLMGTQLQGRCLIIGSFFPIKQIQISVTGVPATVTNGTKNMTVKAFNVNGTASGPTITVTAFITVVDIGATLNIAGNQASGTYSGGVNVNANYLP